MKLIEDFIKQYNKEFDFFQELSRLTSNRIEDSAFKTGIKAIITYRAKRPDRLKEKLLKRNTKKNYKTLEDISTDIIDLAGVRVALYFPSDRHLVDQLINEQFVVIEKKEFPETPHNPKDGKKFSGYWAIHYRVKNKENAVDKRYTDSIIEIQVASVLMHAWAEVEHDLVYKPLSGSISEDELAILDEINGLVLAGEIALERLQKSIAERTKKNDAISDSYELTSLILNSLGKEYLTKLNLGDTYLLNNYFNTVSKFDYNSFRNFLEKINPEAKNSISDQLLDMLISNTFQHDKPNFNKYFKSLTTKTRSGFESFLKAWIVLEQALRITFDQNELKQKNKLFVPDVELIKHTQILSDDELLALKSIKRIRNNLVHGIEIPTDNELAEYFKSLKELTEKIIRAIKNKSTKDKLLKDLKEIS